MNEDVAGGKGGVGDSVQGDDDVEEKSNESSLPLSATLMDKRRITLIF